MATREMALAKSLSFLLLSGCAQFEPPPFRCDLPSSARNLDVLTARTCAGLAAILVARHYCGLDPAALKKLPDTTRRVDFTADCPSIESPSAPPFRVVAMNGKPCADAPEWEATDNDALCAFLAAAATRGDSALEPVPEEFRFEATDADASFQAATITLVARVYRAGYADVVCESVEVE